MKKLLPLLSLFLASCASYHSHHVDGVYEDEGYYASDYNYDPYYGYGGQSTGYSGDGSGVYFNNYNYYPDRWGVNYSSDYYSPYRFPRIGFYYSDCFSLTWGCYGYGSFNSWSSWSPWNYGGFGYSSWHYDDYFWYNHWRHRNYNPSPGYGPRYSARREVTRLADRQRNSRNKYHSPSRQGIKPARVTRDRSRYNTPNHQPARANLPRSNQSQRQRSRNNQSAVGQQQTHNYSVARNYSNRQNDSRNELRQRPQNRTQEAWVARDLQQNSRSLLNKPDLRLNNSGNNTQTTRYQRYNKPVEVNTHNGNQWQSNRNNMRQETNQQQRTQHVPLEQFNKPTRINPPTQVNNSNSNYKPSSVEKSSKRSRKQSSKREKSSRGNQNR